MLEGLEKASGREPVALWCMYLALGRAGMASHELADLLARKLGAESTEAAEEARMTALRIERALRRYLQRRGGQLDFFHGQLRQAVSKQYGTEADTTELHGDVADYFTACAEGTDPQKEWETDIIRGFYECVFHLTKAGLHQQAAGLQRIFPFLLNRLRLGWPEFEDYYTVRHEAPAEVAKRLEIWATFFREKSHMIPQQPPIIFNGTDTGFVDKLGRFVLSQKWREALADCEISILLLSNGEDDLRLVVYPCPGGIPGIFFPLPNSAWGDLPPRGEFSYRVDPKGRICIPARCRQQFAGRNVMFVGCQNHFVVRHTQAPE